MEPGHKIGKYEIRDLLAKGGMAEVYVAVLRGAAGFEKRVALKRILPNLENIGDFQQMFAREARLVARLAHDNVVQVHDFDRVEGLGFYITMELVDGCDLTTLWRGFLEDGRNLPFPLAIRIALEIAAALAHAHGLTDEHGRSLGLVHRDISPQNVLLSRDGAVKLTDFGIAKAYAAAAGEGTRTGVLKGKFAYMSPEQTRGKPLDGRSDLFSLGVLLWELLCGRRLFREAEDLATLEAVRGREVPPPTSLNPEVPEALDAVVLRALARDRAERYQTAAELIADLEPLAAGGLGLRGREAIGRAVRERLAARPATAVFSDEPVSAAAPAAETRHRPPGATPPSNVAAPTTVAMPRGRGPWPWIALAVLILGAGAAGLYHLLLPPEEPPLPAPQAELMAAIAEGLTTAHSSPEPPSESPPAPARVARPSPVRAPAETSSGAEASEKTRIEPRPRRARRARGSPADGEAAAVGATASGTLSINVLPWGSVWVDGKELGDAPVQGLKLSPGQHHVRAEHPRLGRREQEVGIRPGDNGTLILRFDTP